MRVKLLQCSVSSRMKEGSLAPVNLLLNIKALGLPGKRNQRLPPLASKLLRDQRSGWCPTTTSTSALRWLRECPLCKRGDRSVSDYLRSLGGKREWLTFYQKGPVWARQVKSLRPAAPCGCEVRGWGAGRQNSEEIPLEKGVENLLRVEREKEALGWVLGEERREVRGQANPR